MARVTVEDCVDKVPNRFDLVMLAAHRSREIASGSTITIDRDNDKNPVVALRELADEVHALKGTHLLLAEDYASHEAGFAAAQDVVGGRAGGRAALYHLDNTDPSRPRPSRGFGVRGRVH